MTLTTRQHLGFGAPLPTSPGRITETTAIRVELMHAVALHERVGRPAPCRTEPEPFTADDAAQRTRAAVLCGGCRCASCAAPTPPRRARRGESGAAGTGREKGTRDGR